MFKVKCIKSYGNPNNRFSLALTSGKFYEARLPDDPAYRDTGYISIKADTGKIHHVHPESLIGREHLIIRNCETCVKRKCNSCEINKEI